LHELQRFRAYGAGTAEAAEGVLRRNPLFPGIARLRAAIAWRQPRISPIFAGIA
jgi:hypothetical protein